MFVQPPPLNTVLDRVLVNSESGEIFWRPTPAGSVGRPRPQGVQAGSLQSGGYRILILMIDGKRHTLFAHRIIWAAVNGSWPVNEIDHINGVKNDNRIANLRPATHLENARNRKTYTNNTSGYKGVSWNAYHKKWSATIRVAKKAIYLGYFDTPEEASLAYRAASMQNFGEFARNEPAMGAP